MRRLPATLTLALLPLFCVPAAAGEADTQTLVDELRQLADQARQQRAADRWLQRALDDMVARYDWPWRKELVFDDFGEWVELYNPGTQPVPLEGLSIVEPTANKSHTIVGCTLFVPPKGYFVLGANGDKTKNGGVDIDYAYNIGTLKNFDGGVEIRVGATVIDSVSWKAGVWPSPAEFDGKAASLDPAKLDAAKNDKYAFTWCPASTPMSGCR